MGRFAAEGRRVALLDFVTRYNEIVDEFETELPLAPPALERPDSARIISSMTPGVKMAWPNSVTGPLHYYDSPMIYLERSAALLEGRFALPHAAFALRLRTRPSGLRTFEATFAFTVVTAR